MKWKVTYKESVKKDFKKISKNIQKLIFKAIEEKLMSDPLKYGKPLRRTLKNYMKLRVGDYRVIYEVREKEVVVCVVKVGHRKEVYEK